MKSAKAIAATVLGATLWISGCGSSDVQTNPVGSTNNGSSFQQVEQLARPGINEALLRTNLFLNIYNSVSPAFISRALVAGTPENTAAAPVLGEAIDSLNLFTALDGPGGANTTTLAAAFLPDVMRIDTSINTITSGTTAYSAAFVASGPNAGAPAAGRKLTDDVVDITLTVLTGGTVTTDNVPYYPNANPGVGHQRLNQQLVDNGPATFPFLAPAN